MKLLKLTQEKIENLYRSLTNEDIKLVMKKLFTKKRADPDVFTGKVYETLKDELILIFQKFLRK